MHVVNKLLIASVHMSLFI